jgi:hypothetical protein
MLPLAWVLGLREATTHACCVRQHRACAVQALSGVEGDGGPRWAPVAGAVARPVAPGGGPWQGLECRYWRPSVEGRAPHDARWTCSLARAASARGAGRVGERKGTLAWNAARNVLFSFKDAAFAFSSMVTMQTEGTEPSA